MSRFKYITYSESIKAPVQYWLTAKIAYDRAWRFMTDDTFDKLSLYIHDNWDKIEHQDKKYLDKDSISYTSMTSWKEGDLPDRIWCAIDRRLTSV